MASMFSYFAPSAVGVERHSVTSPLREQRFGKGNDAVYAGLASMALLASFFFEFADIAIVLIGAVAYLSLRPKTTIRAKKVVDGPKIMPQTEHTVAQPPPATSNAGQRRNAGRSDTGPVNLTKVTRSVVPVNAPSFSGIGLDAEVKELLTRLAPSFESEAICQRIHAAIREAIAPLLPEVDITVFANGNPKGGKAFAVAVPEVEVVVGINSETLSSLLREARTSDPRQLQKNAIRVFTDQLVSSGQFKFRRSAFKSDDPKVTLLAPAACDSLPFDLMVNVDTPSHHATLLNECRCLEPRTNDLILLVQRWARDRGIAHASKGHFSPFAWSLVVIRFLQASVESKPALLPALEVSANGFIRKSSSGPQRGTSDATVLDLFTQFFAFYANNYNWQRCALSVRGGSTSVALPSVEWRMVALPSIEDPFTPRKDLASGMTADTFGRLKEELLRGHTLMSFGKSLSVLLEPWTPADVPASECAAKCAVEVPATKPIAALPQNTLTARPIQLSLRPGGVSLRPGARAMNPVGANA